jgi:hypothetical protein
MRDKSTYPFADKEKAKQASAKANKKWTPERKKAASLRMKKLWESKKETA